MKRPRILLTILTVLLILAIGTSGWLWYERTSVISSNATTQAEFGKLKEQITAADGVQDKNRQLQDQVNDLQQQLDQVQRGEIVQPTPEPNAPTPDPNDPTATPTPVDPNATPAPTPGGVEPPPEVVQIMLQIEQEVIELRGLPEERPVTRRMLTRDELKERIIKDMEEENTPEDYRHSVQEMWLLGLGEKDLDLEALFIELQTEQILGFYDPEEDTFYIISEKATLPPVDQITYAHEFNHNLQDQEVDLNAALKANEFDSDRSMAFRSLVEGDATELMANWTQEKLVARLSPAELTQLLDDLNSQGGGSDILDRVPRIMREGLMFPYNEGQKFVLALKKQGGWEAVTKALSDPPTSSEQILHPEKYLAAQRDEPNLPDRFDLTSALGLNWTTATTSTLGEFDLRILLEDTKAQGDTDNAAAGIGGIRYALYEQSESKTPLLQMTTRWDTPTDGDEFLQVFRSTLTGSGDVQQRGEIFVAIKGSGQEYTILFSPDEQALRTALAALP